MKLSLVRVAMVAATVSVAGIALGQEPQFTMQPSPAGDQAVAVPGGAMPMGQEGAGGYGMFVPVYTNGAPVYGSGAPVYSGIPGGASVYAGGAPVLASAAPVYTNGAPVYANGAPVYANGAPVYATGAQGAPVYAGGPAIYQGSGPVFAGPGPVYGGGPVYGDGPVYGNSPCCGAGPCCGDMECCECTHEYVYTHFDVMFLSRDQEDSQPFTFDPALNATVLSSGDLEFDYEAVTRVLAGIEMCDGNAIEVSYFGLQNWEDEEFALPTDPNVPLENVFGLQSVSEEISYESELHNAELNLVCNCRSSCRGEFSTIAGFRYFGVYEEFDYTIVDVEDITTVTNIEADNILIGIQGGARAMRRLGCKCRIEAEAKGGVFVNLASQWTSFDQFENGQPITHVPVHDRDDVLALVGDVGVQFTYDCCCWLTFRAGLHALYADGLAPGPENFNPELLALIETVGDDPPSDLEDDGNILYHGATAGMEIRW